MSISKLTWALSVLAALSLGGCALEPYEDDQDEGAIGEVAWDLSQEEDLAGPDDGEEEDELTKDGTFDGDDGPEYWGEAQSGQENPYDRIDSRTGPHPDPWDDWRTAGASGTGDKDD